MAEKLEEFKFGSMRARGGSTYDPYLEIPEGETESPIWKLSSEDSSNGAAQIKSMQTTIANVAKRQGKKLRSNVITETRNKGKGTEYEEEFLVIQAYYDEEDE